MPSTLPHPPPTPPNPTVCLSHTHTQCFVSFQKGAQHIAAGMHHFHAIRLITNAYEQEPVTVTGSSHNKRVPVSEKLARGVTNLLKVCHVLNTNWSIFTVPSAGFPLRRLKVVLHIKQSFQPSFTVQSKKPKRIVFLKVFHTDCYFLHSN